MSAFVRGATVEETELLDLLARESGARAVPPHDGHDYRPTVRVVSCSGQVAGFACVYLPEPAARADALLDIVFVFEQWRGQGVGRLLFDDLCSLAESHGSTRLRVLSHPWAQGFFQHVGARRVGAAPPCSRVAWYRRYSTSSSGVRETQTCSCRRSRQSGDDARPGRDHGGWAIGVGIGRRSGWD